MDFKKANYSSPGEPGKRGFEDLQCYQLALDVIVNAYELARNVPQEEKYDLAVQIRRSSKSVTANIAEGYGRYHYLESLKCYSTARGELNETLSHFINASVLGYIEKDSFHKVNRLIRKTEEVLNGYMRYVRHQKAGDTPSQHGVKEDEASYTYDDPSAPSIDEDEST